MPRRTTLAFALLTVLALFSSFPAPPAVAAANETVFTTDADLAAAEARARMFPLNRLARQSLLATAARIIADGGRLGDGRFAWEQGALVLAYAYRSTGDVTYAELAARVLTERTLAEQPRLANRVASSLAAANEVLMRSQRATFRAQTYTLLSTFTGARWTSTDRGRLRDWLATFGRDLRDGFAPGECITNAKWFHLEGIAAAGAVSGDQALLDFAFASYKRYLDSATCGGKRVIGSQGLLEHEMRRFTVSGDDTWYYAGYSLLGMVRLAEIARNQGVDLYDYTTPDGRSLRQALDAHVPFLLGKPWPNQGGNVSYPITHREFMQAYELAYAHWPDPDYLAVLKKYGDERRASELTDCLGPAAYLYANRPAQGTPPPLPTTIPNLPPATAPLVVYSDQLATGWRDWSWDADVALESRVTVQSGTSAIAVRWQRPWGTVRFHATSPIATAGLAWLRFWVHGGTSGGQALQLFVERDDGSRSAPVRLPAPRTQAWTLVEVPLSQLGSPARLTDMFIQDIGGSQSGAPFTLDTITLAP